MEPDSIHFLIDPARIHIISDRPAKNGPVVYWMGRDQRVHDNWAMLYAQEQALARRQPLIIIFCLSPAFSVAGQRQYDFMLRGLIEVAKKCETHRVPFILLIGDPVAEIPRFFDHINAGLLTVDFDPLHIRRDWIRRVSGRLTIPVHEIDAHNIVPCRAVSDHREYAARTIRPKIQRMLERFLVDIPPVGEHPYPPTTPLPTPDWNTAWRIVADAGDVPPVDWLRPGTTAGMEMLDLFLESRLAAYAKGARDPNAGVESDLSPYLHFGQISAQHAALAVQSAPNIPDDSRDAFLEQLVVRRELSDNFCLYADNYDALDALPEWAWRTLDEHRLDPREYNYDRTAFEHSHTHDPLWNAAQREMVIRGKMHGYLRMYWAKKILEWSESPEDALATALYLNDRYELDGRDPNGFVGVLWSIGGLHDRPWRDRPVTGSIRSMTYDGCRRKFDVDRYISQMSTLNV